MGYISKNIAKITEPERVSLAGQPNFFIIEPLEGAEKILLSIGLSVNISSADPETSAQLTVYDSKGVQLYSVTGSGNPEKTGGSVYYISNEKNETAENIKNAFLNNAWMASMFEIDIPLGFDNGIPVAGKMLYLKSKGAGSDYNIRIKASDPQAFLITHTPENGSVRNDSISGEENMAGIEVDIYEDTGVILGSDDRPLGSGKMGRHILSLRKNYAGAPLWFDLNVLFSKKAGYNLPPAGENPAWFDTGTMNDFRFAARIKGINSTPFYYSNTLYVLNGYGSPLEAFDLTPYIFDNTRPIRLLSNKPRSTYMKGQKEYLNFIFSDPGRGIDLGNAEYRIGAAYSLYNGNNEFITTVYDENKNIARASLQAVNTCETDLTAALEQYPETARAELFVTRNNIAISDTLTLDILPECLHRLNPFTFLNRLGGWDSFNADAEIITENKQTATTFGRSPAPGMKKGESLETVYSKEIKQSYAFETPLLHKATRVWLQELVASPVILDPNRNYIIIEDIKLMLSEDKDTFSMKYRITEKYNG